MSGYIVLGILHVLLFMFLRWYTQSEFVRRGGDLTISNLAILCVILFPAFMVFTGIAMDLVGAKTGADRFTVGGVSILFSMVWALPFIFMTTEVLSNSSVNQMMGLNRELLDEADLTKAHELFRKNDRTGAITELNRLRKEFPTSPSPRFMLAILSEDDDNYEAAADYYREVLQQCKAKEAAWLNAAGSLAALLREHLDDESGARYLEDEIRKRNPDSEYKLSKTRDRKAIEEQAKKRIGPSMPKNRAQKKQERLLDLNHARRLVNREEIPEAIGLFGRYLTENPGAIKVHFELVTLFERTGRTDDAVTRLQKLIHEFAEDDDVWGNAMLRLATIRQVHDGDREVALSLLNSVATRLKHAKHGVEARQRLRDLAGGKAD